MKITCNDCGHVMRPLLDPEFLVKVMIEHGHFPTKVRITCLCGEELEAGPAIDTDPISAAEKLVLWFSLHQICGKPVN